MKLKESFLIGRTQRVILSTSKSDWINLYQRVPQGTVLGPLLFNIYVNNMKSSIQSPINLVQYADDTFIFAAAKDIETSVAYLQKGLKTLSDFFAIHRLNINADKTEFVVFCKASKNSSIENATLKVGDHIIKQKESVKYLGVYLDRNLNYQSEVKNILRKMACSIKTIYVRDFLPVKTRLLLLNSLVISNFYSSY